MRRTTLILIFLLAIVPGARGGEFSEPVDAGELKITNRVSGEDLHQALERAMKQLPEHAQVVGVECVPEFDGLITCAYHYRDGTNGDGSVSCADYSTYRMCRDGQKCYPEGAILAQKDGPKICARERVSRTAPAELIRLTWKPAAVDEWQLPKP